MHIYSCHLESASVERNVLFIGVAAWSAYVCCETSSGRRAMLRPSTLRSSSVITSSSASACSASGPGSLAEGRRERVVVVKFGSVSRLTSGARAVPAVVETLRSKVLFRRDAGPQASSTSTSSSRLANVRWSVSSQVRAERLTQRGQEKPGWCCWRSGRMHL